VQWGAAASQKFTSPGARESPLTVAVSVTTVPDCTLLTDVPPDVRASVVCVAAGVAASAVIPQQKPKPEATKRRRERNIEEAIGRAHGK
jgi:hypothetical protein